MREIFKDLPNYEGLYKVSNLGRVKHIKKNKVLDLKPNSTGYVSTTLINKDKHYRTYGVHQLVAMTFLNHTPNGSRYVIDHIDNNKSNNAVTNLQVITQRQNLSKNKKGTSKFPGVFYIKKRNKFSSQIMINGNIKYLGVFDSEEEAYNKYKNELNKLKKNEIMTESKKKKISIDFPVEMYEELQRISEQEERPVNGTIRLFLKEALTKRKLK